MFAYGVLKIYEVGISLKHSGEDGDTMAIYLFIHLPSSHQNYSSHSQIPNPEEKCLCVCVSGGMWFYKRNHVFLTLNVGKRILGATLPVASESVT